MHELIKGHRYVLRNLKDSGTTTITFHMDPKIHGKSLKGPSTQEVLRACIARVKALDEECPAQENAGIIFHLRQAIMLFELRAVRRQMEKHEVETMVVGPRGHIFGHTDDVKEQKDGY